ncbi:MAG: M28 family peptidase [Bacteroidetes bacterium]|nr:M28 family peptidase [Bacteroidota bacterium]
MVILLFLIPSGKGLLSQSLDKTAMKFAQTITAEDAKKHLSILASDEYEGRETGKEGQKKAAKYIADDFKKIGLKSVTDSTYLQKFPLTLNTPEGADLKIGGKKYENYNDFYVFPLGHDLNLESKSILFLGYGISDKKYDDYKNADVKDKILLVLGGEPIREDSISFLTGTKELSDWTSDFRKKSRFAKSKGASALVVINMNFEANIQFLKNFLESPTLKLNSDKSEEKLSDKKEERKKIPQIGLSIQTANEILSSEKMNVDDIKNKIRTSKQPLSFEIKNYFEIEIKNREDKIYSENVLGMIQGNEFKDEVVFVTAHYDHLGVRDGKVFNGADDDGSGTVGVMEIAEAFSLAKEAGFTPKRTMVFMTVAGEEKGLLGSSYYTDNPVFPIANTVCDLNIDMIGRTDDSHKDSINYLYIIGSDKISTDLHRINENANSTYTKLKLDYKYNDLNDPNRFYYRSDHYNFAEKGVPIIFYFNGTHEDYHQETDEVSKINFDLLAKRAQLVFYTAWEVANRTNRIVSDVPQEKEKK